MASSEARGPADPGGVIGALYRAHDLLTRISFQLAVLSLGLIAASFCYEVVARYAFNAPTIWANPIVSYLMCAMIFLALPELTRTGQHIAINILIDALPSDAAGALAQLIRLVGLAACLLAAWFTGSETLHQYIGGIQTMTFWPIPKWIVSVFIPYGLASASLYFLRQMLGDRSAIVTGGSAQ